MDYILEVLDSLKLFWLDALAALPRLAVGTVLFIAGWLLAKLSRKVVLRLLHLARVNVLAERSGIEGFLIQGGVRYTLETLLANLVYWLVLLTMALAVLQAMGLHVAADLIDRIVQYVPNVVVAVLVLIFGSLLASFIRTATTSYLSNIGVQGAKFIGAAAYVAILFFVITLALDQLTIAGAILVSAFQIAFGAVCLALALAFGLGGRDWAARILDRTWKK